MLVGWAIDDMDKPLVSICISVFNGQKYLRHTLDSFLAQDYKNFELIILDNISTDDTQKICLSYAEKDKRIKYILDDFRVGDPEGHHRVARYARGEFFLLACDDDVYAPTYISKLMEIMNSNPDIGLVYSGLGYIYEDGSRMPVHMKESYFLSADNSKFHNFCFYLLHRCPIPLQFGLMKTEIHREALRYFYKVDNRGGDHDNLYMLRLLSLTKVSSLKDVLFYYRQKDRSYQRPAGFPDTWLKRYLYQAKHQALVTRTISCIIDDSPFSHTEKCILKCYNIFVLFVNITLKYLITIPACCRLYNNFMMVVNAKAKCKDG
ncbi:MAG: glycosyltransferase family A protein [Candidatus Methanoperedens sp.]